MLETQIIEPDLRHFVLPKREIKAPPSSAEWWGLRLALVVLLVWALAPAIGFVVSLSILTALGFLGALIGIRAPAIGLFGVSLLVVLDPFSRVYLMSGGLLRWNTFNYLLVLITLLFVRDLFRLKSVTLGWLFMLVAVVGLYLFVSPDVERGTYHFLNVFSQFGLLIYFLRGAREQGVWYWLGIINGALGAAGGLIFLLQKESLDYINPNAFSLFPLTAMFSICLAFRPAERKRGGQIILLILATANFTWTFLSGSRGGLLVACIGLIFLLLQVESVSRRAAYLGGALILGLGVLGFFSDQENYTLSRLNMFWNEDESASTRTSGRIDLALGGWYIFLQHPLGVGTGGYAMAWEQLGTQEGLSGFRQGEEFESHSAFVKVLAENGIAGFVILAGYLLSFLYAGLHRPEKGLLQLGALATATLGVAFVSTEFQSKGLWFLAAGVTVLMRRRRRKSWTHLVPNSGRLIYRRQP